MRNDKGPLWGEEMRKFVFREMRRLSSEASHEAAAALAVSQLYKAVHLWCLCLRHRLYKRCAMC